MLSSSIDDDHDAEVADSSVTSPTSTWTELARTCLTRIRERSGSTKKSLSRAQKEFKRMKTTEMRKTGKGHCWTMCLFALLWLCFAGCCFALTPYDDLGTFFGTGLGEVSNGTLVALQTYCCPWDTQGSRSRSDMASLLRVKGSV